MMQEHSIIAVYESHDAAEDAVRALEQAGLGMKRLTIVGQDLRVEEHARVVYAHEGRAASWAGRGALLGALWGLLFGDDFFFEPSFGPLVLVPLLSWAAGALQGGVVGGAAGILAAALGSIGVPGDSVATYEHELEAGGVLLLAHGTADALEHARVILGATRPSRLAAYAP